MTKPFDIPPPGGYGATPEEQRLAMEQMERDAARLSGNHIAAEMARIAEKTQAAKGGQEKSTGEVIQ